MVTGMPVELPCPVDFPFLWVTEYDPTSRGEASIRTPKVPVRLQRHRAWEPFLCTSSQSLAVHIPCWSALYPEESWVHLPAYVPLHTGISEMVGDGRWGCLELGNGIPHGANCTVDRLGHIPEFNRDKRVPEWGPHGPGGSHCTQIALLRFAVCSRRNSRLIGDTRAPLRKLRPWKTATLTTGEFITGFWGSLRRQPSGLGYC